MLSVEKKVLEESIEGRIPIHWTGLVTGICAFRFYRFLQSLTGPHSVVLGTAVPHPTHFPWRLAVQDTKKAGMSTNDHNTC